jgi:hypothetical protein
MMIFNRFFLFFSFNPLLKVGFFILIYRCMILKFDEYITESLPRQKTVDQWNKLRRMTKGVDIGDRISDMNKQGANIQYIQNPIDTGIESYEDYEKHNKKFVPSWNLKHLLSPFSGESKNKKQVK